MKTPRMFRIYVAGAITPTGKDNLAIEFLSNIRAGVRASIRLIKNGFTPVCPMLDFQYFLCLTDKEQISAKEIYETSITLMLGCDAILILPGAENSIGWKEERNIAVEEGIPIYKSIEDIIRSMIFGELKCRL